MAVPARVIVGFVGATEPVNLHQGNAGLDQSAGQQNALAKLAPAIAITHGSRLLIEPEGAPCSGRPQQTKSLLRLLVEVTQGAAAVHGIDALVALLQRRATCFTA